MTKSVENAKPIGKLLEAVHDVVERDLALKLYEPKHLRLTIAKRKEVAQVYIASGMSQREAALALGVNQSTIQRDLGKKKQPGRANSPDEGKKPPINQNQAGLIASMSRQKVQIPQRQAGLIDPNRRATARDRRKIGGLGIRVAGSIKK